MLKKLADALLAYRFTLICSLPILWWLLIFFIPYNFSGTAFFSKKNTHFSEYHFELTPQALSGDLQAMNTQCQLWLNAIGEDHNPKLKLSIDNLQAKLHTYQEPSQNSSNRFVAQSYLSACYLLSLAPIEQIVAIPKGMRAYGHFFPNLALDNIRLNAERENAEAIYIKKPKLVFTASYSLPKTIETFTKQGIQCLPLLTPENLVEVGKLYLQVGKLIGNEKKGEIMHDYFFLHLAIIHSLAHKMHKKTKAIRVLILNYFGHFSFPGKLSIDYALLRFLNIDFTHNKLTQDLAPNWSHPLDKEALQNLNPDLIFLSSSSDFYIPASLSQDPFFQQLSAIGKKQLFALDEKICQNPSPLIIFNLLAIIQALQQYSIDHHVSAVSFI